MTSWTKARESALKRDSFTCQYCGSTDNLDIHHITYLENGGTNDLNNLITLCEKCHQKIHSNDNVDVYRKRMQPLWDKLYADKMKHLIRPDEGFSHGLVLLRLLMYLDNDV